MELALRAVRVFLDRRTGETGEPIVSQVFLDRRTGETGDYILAVWTPAFQSVSPVLLSVNPLS